MQTRLMAASWCLLAPLAATAEQPLDVAGTAFWADSARNGELVAELDPYLETRPGNDDQLLVRYRGISYELGDDTVSKTVTRIFQFNSNEAIQDYGNMRVLFDAATQKAYVEEALVIDSDGNRIVVNPGTVQVVSSDTYNVFSDYQEIVIPMNGLDVGSLAIIRSTISTDRKLDIAPWSAIHQLQYGVPIDNFSIDIAWAPGQAKPVWQSRMEALGCSDSSERSVRCVTSDIEPYPLTEDAYYDDFLPTFVASQSDDWTDIHAWYQPLFSTALTSGDDVRATAQRLSDGLDDEEEVLKAIHEFVTQSVRYVGLEHGESAFVPHDTATTLERRYGDCKDKAALTADLLAQVGIQATPVLVSTSRRDPTLLEVPASAYFDHLIVCGEMSNGKPFCLDGTDPYNGVARLSDWIQGAVSLPVTGEGAPGRLPMEDYRWSLVEDLEMQFRADGSVIEKSNVDYVGVYGATIRRSLSAMSDKERQEWALEDYQNTVSGLVEPSFGFSGIDEANEDLAISWETRYDELLAPDERLDYVESRSWLNQIIRTFESENEAFDYFFEGLRYEGTVSVNVDEQWEIGLTGPEIHLKSRFGEFRQDYEVDGQAVVVRTSFDAPAKTLAPGDLEDFKQFMQIVRSESNFRVAGDLRD